MCGTASKLALNKLLVRLLQRGAKDLTVTYIPTYVTVVTVVTKNLFQKKTLFTEKRFPQTTLKNQNVKNSKTQNVTKLKNSIFDKSYKLKM